MTEPEKIEKGSVRLFTSGTDHTLVTEDGYSRFSYPKLIKLMKFDVRRYRINGFGNMMTMRTKGPFGMRLLTMSFMPFEGNSVPYLLTDIMEVGKKRLIFVEYYDCTAERSEQPLLKRVCEKYSECHSMIKSLEADSKVSLSEIAADSIRAYKKSAFSAGKSGENLAGLMKFRERMINEGNPSSDILKKVFGEKGAADFFKKCVMPEK